MLASTTFSYGTLHLATRFYFQHHYIKDTLLPAVYECWENDYLVAVSLYLSNRLTQILVHTLMVISGGNEA